MTKKAADKAAFFMVIARNRDLFALLIKVFSKEQISHDIFASFWK